MLGFLREDKEKALKAGLDPDFKLKRSGLDEYLKFIFPETNDWVHDKSMKDINKLVSRKRPDYRSESLKLIVEFDGLPHYQSPKQIIKDKENTLLYESLGYKVIRIPYFIQLTQEAIKILFNKEVNHEYAFPNDIPSLGINSEATPAYLCYDGIQKMKEDFQKFPSQYNLNIDYLKSQPEEFYYLHRVDLII